MTFKRATDETGQVWLIASTDSMHYLWDNNPDLPHDILIPRVLVLPDYESQPIKQYYPDNKAVLDDELMKKTLLTAIYNKLLAEVQ